jgi:hypothetical protein
LTPWGTVLFPKDFIIKRKSIPKWQKYRQAFALGYLWRFGGELMII